MSTSVETRPEQRCAWHGSSLLIVNGRGDCDATNALSGFYYREARFLRTLRLLINGESPWLCERGEPTPSELVFNYVYPELTRFGGGGSGSSRDDSGANEYGIAYRSVDLSLSYQVGIAELRVLLSVTNRGRAPIALTVAWQVAADFADLLEATGGGRRQQADIASESGEHTLEFRYEHDTLHYRTRLGASGAGKWTADPESISANVELASQASAELVLTIRAIDFVAPLSVEDVERREIVWRQWRERAATVEATQSAMVERIVRANCDDLSSFAQLEGEPDEWLVLQAGIPLYPALFGRYTLTAGWQSAWMDRGESLEASVTRLARLQGTTVDAIRDEEPGRIVQQVRGGPLSRLGMVPYGRYYADFASPLMFVISLAQLFAWTGDRSMLERHWDAARRVLDWARSYGDADGDGYLEYETRSPLGPKHQGWKDSGDAIPREDGTSVPAPIGTCEIQGYWFAAQEMMAVLSWVMHRHDDANEHWRSAQELKARFNRDWWLAADGFVALAMDAEKNPIRAIASNAGHCVASGIVSDEHLPRLVARLFEPDSFSGWGVRTLASTHAS